MDILKLKKKEIYFRKPYNYNIYEKNKIKKFFNFLIFYFFMKTKKNEYYIIEDNLEYKSFNRNLNILANFYFTNRMKYFSYDNYKKFYYNPVSLPTHILNFGLDSNYIYQIKVSSKKYLTENINNFLNKYLSEKDDKKFLKTLEWLQKNKFNIFKNLFCVKKMFSYNFYFLLDEYIEENYNHICKYIFFQNYVFVYGENKDEVFNEGEKILTFLKNNKIHYQKNKTHFIDKEKNDLIIRNFVIKTKKIVNLEDLNDLKKIFDEHSLCLIEKFKKNQYLCPLNTYDINILFFKNNFVFQRYYEFFYPKNILFKKNTKFLEINFQNEKIKKIIIKITIKIVSIIFLIFSINFCLIFFFKNYKNLF